MTRLDARVAAAFPQLLMIRIDGPAVLRFPPFAPPDDEAPLPDLGDLLVGAARSARWRQNHQTERVKSSDGAGLGKSSQNPSFSQIFP